MARVKPALTDPNVLAALGALGAFWYFLYQATDGRGREQPVWIRWATWW